MWYGPMELLADELENTAVDQIRSDYGTSSIMWTLGTQASYGRTVLAVRGGEHASEHGNQVVV